MRSYGAENHEGRSATSTKITKFFVCFVYAARTSWLLLLLLIAACSHSAPEEVESETVVPVTTEPAQRGTIRAVIHATGIVTPAPGADLVVIAPEAAKIAEIPKAEGDRVRRGDVLVRFEIPSLAVESATRRAEVTRAEARLENARAAQSRAHDLFDRGIAARKEVEEADRDRAEAEASLTEARGTLAASEMSASRAIVRATFEGVVARRAHNPGDFVEPTATDIVLRVIDPRRLEVSAAIPLADVSRVAIGAAARLAGVPDEDAGAMKVVSRPAAVQPDTASAPVRLAFTTPVMLAVGTPVQVDIDAEQHANVVVVPETAIVREGEETFVFVAAGNKAQRRAVTLGLSDGMHAEIRSGVQAGDAVIVRGQAGLPDGAAISVEAAGK
jgi:RND family efflux transporter MFP subunit